MINDIKSVDSNLRKNKVAVGPLRGNMAIVSYAYKRNEISETSNVQKARCVWPVALKNSDTKFLTRRITAKIF